MEDRKEHVRQFQCYTPAVPEMPEKEREKRINQSQAIL